MNATTETEPDVTFVQAAVPLIKEYSEKLKDLAGGVVSFVDRLNKGSFPVYDIVLGELVSRFQFLKPPVEELIRQSSAVLNEGSLRGLEKVELWLRLAELEHQLETASQHIDRIKPKK